MCETSTLCLFEPMKVPIYIVPSCLHPPGGMGGWTQDYTQVLAQVLQNS